MENLISTESTQKNTIFELSSQKRKSKIIDIDKISLNLNKSMFYYNKFIKKENNHENLLQLKQEVDKIKLQNLKLYKQMLNEMSDLQEKKQLEQSIEQLRSSKYQQQQKNYKGYLNELIILEKKNQQIKEQLIHQKKRNRSWTVSKKYKKNSQDKKTFSIFQFAKKIKSFVDDDLQSPLQISKSQQFKSKKSQQDLLNKKKNSYHTYQDYSYQRSNKKLNQLIQKRLSKQSNTVQDQTNRNLKTDVKKTIQPTIIEKKKIIKTKNIQRRVPQRSKQKKNLEQTKNQHNDDQKKLNKSKNKSCNKKADKKQTFLKPKKNKNNQKLNTGNSNKKLKKNLQYDLNQKLKQGNNQSQKEADLDLPQDEKSEKPNSKSRSSSSQKDISKSTITIVQDQNLHSDIFQEMNEENMTEETNSDEPESFEQMLKEKIAKNQLLSRYTFGFGKLEFNSQKQLCINQFPILDSIKEQSVSNLNQDKNSNNIEQVDSIVYGNPFIYKKYQEQSLKELENGNLSDKKSANIMSYESGSKSNIFRIDSREFKTNN